MAATNYTVTVRLRNRASGAQSAPYTVNYSVGTVDPPTDPPPPAVPLLVGSSNDLNTGETWTQGLVRRDATMGPLDVVRVFYPGLPDATWAGSKPAQCNRPVVVSFKALPADINAGKHDALLQGWFNSMPKNTFKIWWAFYHEPEDNIEAGSFTAAQFRTAFRRIAGLARAANNPNLINTLILMGWTVNSASGRNFNDFYPGGDVVDVMAWDNYSVTSRYQAPAEIYDRIVAKSKEIGKPWGIAETGAAKLSSDATGSGHAAWISSVRTYILAQNPKPVFITYWDNDVPSADYRLNTAAAQKAWSNWAKEA